MDNKERFKYILSVLSDKYDYNYNHDYDSYKYKPTEKLTIDDLIENHGISKILDHIGEDKIQDYLRIKKIQKLKNKI